jgi:hypothetical protein
MRIVREIALRRHRRRVIDPEVSGLAAAPPSLRRI